MQDIIDGLLARAGPYAGHGIDHQDQPFHGELVLDPLPGGGGVILVFRAHGIDGTVYRDERAWIAPDAEGRLALWSVHSGRRGVRKHVHRPGAPPEGAAACHVFAHGDFANRDELRVELALDLWPDGEIGYRLSAGAAGATIASRSCVRMAPVEPDVVED